MVGNILKSLETVVKLEESLKPVWGIISFGSEVQYTTMKVVLEDLWLWALRQFENHIQPLVYTLTK